MNLEWADPRASKFVTSVGLVTSRGKWGDNIMTAEWVHQISYSPGLIAVCIGKSGKATAENIKETKEFGVHLAARDQNVLASIAGGSSGKKVDKVAVLKELGFNFSEAEKIKVLMVQETAFAAECRLREIIDLGGSHEMFVGEIVHLYPLGEKGSIVYYKRKYWNEGSQIHKPDEEKMKEFSDLIKKHTKKD